MKIRYGPPYDPVSGHTDHRAAPQFFGASARLDYPIYGRPPTPRRRTAETRGRGSRRSQVTGRNTVDRRPRPGRYALLSSAHLTRIYALLPAMGGSGTSSGTSWGDPSVGREVKDYSCLYSQRLPVKTTRRVGVVAGRALDHRLVKGVHPGDSSPRSPAAVPRPPWVALSHLKPRSHRR